MPNHLRTYWPFIVSALIWIGLIFIVDPIGEFPLNDDWAYSQNVYNLTENGVFQLSDWPAMTLVAHMFYGAIFSLIFGFSFTVLRISTLLLGLLGIFILYRFMAHLGADRRLILFALCLFIVNPLFFSLSYTFMTDVPFMVSFLASLFCYYQYLTTSNNSYFALGTVLAIVTTLIRQLGLGLPLALLITICLKAQRDKRQIAKVFIAFAVTTLIMVTYQWYIKSIGQQSPYYLGPEFLLDFFRNDFALKKFLERLGVLLIYAGFMLSPLSLMLMESKQLRSKTTWTITPIIFLLSFLSVNKIPSGNVLYSLGIGPVVLKGNDYGVELFDQLPVVGAVVIFTIGVLGAILLLGNLIQKYKGEKKYELMSCNQNVLYLLLITIGYGLYVIIDDHFTDRYYMLFIALTLLLQIRNESWNRRSPRLIIATIPMLLLGFYSIGGTHDYLSWNRARWLGLNNLTKSGIKASSIDGGIEFNGWNKTGKRNKPLLYEKSWWFVQDDEYVVTKNDLCGYEVIESIAYTSWLSNRTDSMKVLRRINSSSLDYDSFSPHYETSFEERKSEISKSGSGSIELGRLPEKKFSYLLEGITPCENIIIKFWISEAHQRNIKTSLIGNNPREFTVSSKAQTNHSVDGWYLSEIRLRLPKDYKYNSATIEIVNLVINKTYFLDDLSILRMKE